MEKIDLIMTCPLCGREHSVSVPLDAWEDYQSGALAQHCFWMLDATQREQIISHACPECQAKIFGPDDEDEEW